jgi:hypothetical protein
MYSTVKNEKKRLFTAQKQPALYTSYLILGKFRFIGKLYAEFSHSLDKMGGCLGYGVAGREGKGAELVFLNLYGAQESMPKHQFRQPM